MKKIFLIQIFIVGVIGFAVAQQPVFLSPYKDGREVPDSLKDFSQPARMTLLTDGSGSKSFTVTENNLQNATEQSGKENAEEKTTPVILNNKKVTKVSGK